MSNKHKTMTMIALGLKLTAFSVGMPIESVICDNQYGWAMEEAIIKGNMHRVDKILSTRGDKEAINEVIAVGDESRVWKISGKQCTFYSSLSMNRNLNGNRTPSRMFGTVDILPMGSYYGIFESYSCLSSYDDISSAQLSQGIKKCCILGTPLMIAVRAKKLDVVRELLKRGANPNVFINVADYVKEPRMIKFDSLDPYRPMGQSKSEWERPQGTWTCKRPYLCSLLDCYIEIDKDKVKSADEIAKTLIEHGAGFIKDCDDDGRNMLWDVARVKSVYLLSEMVIRGFDINHKDYEGKTVADYCSEEFAGSKSALCRDFLKALTRLGAKSKDNPTGAGEETGHAKPITLVMGPSSEQMHPSSILQGGYAPVRQPTVIPSVQPKPDNSVEIAALQHRLLTLRMELEDARANRKIATFQGAGWVAASMHEQQIMNEISDCERKIMALR